METIDQALIEGMCPVRDRGGHKGTFGTALIVAGSEFMSGAQTLAVSSALRSGTGMVRVFAPAGSMGSTIVNCPCALLSAWGDTETSTLRMLTGYLEKASACGIGPGLDEKDKRSLAVLEYLIENSPKLVIDAGALNILSRNRERLFPLLSSRKGKPSFEPAILTPHIGEFKRLAGDCSEEVLVQFARDTGCITVLKSNNTIVSTEDGKCYINNVSNNGLAKGGSGDVLTGMITGFLAQGMNVAESALAGVYIHSLCGQLLADRYGRRAMLPSDMPDIMSSAFRACGWENNEN